MLGFFLLLLLLILGFLQEKKTNDIAANITWRDIQISTNNKGFENGKNHLIVNGNHPLIQFKHEVTGVS